MVRGVGREVRGVGREVRGAGCGEKLRRFGFQARTKLVKIGHWMLRALGVGYFSDQHSIVKFDPLANPAIPHLVRHA